MRKTRPFIIMFSALALLSALVLAGCGTQNNLESTNDQSDQNLSEVHEDSEQDSSSAESELGESESESQGEDESEDESDDTPVDVGDSTEPVTNEIPFPIQ